MRIWYVRFLGNTQTPALIVLIVALRELGRHLYEVLVFRKTCRRRYVLSTWLPSVKLVWVII